MDRKSKLWAYQMGVEASGRRDLKPLARKHLNPFRPESPYYVYWTRGFKHLTIDPTDPPIQSFQVRTERRARRVK